jgi:hypothetical protein
VCFFYKHPRKTWNVATSCCEMFKLARRNYSGGSWHAWVRCDWRRCRQVLVGTP